MRASWREHGEDEHQGRIEGEPAAQSGSTTERRGGRSLRDGAERARDSAREAFDIDGILRGKYVSLQKLTGALRKGFGFCDVVFGWDATDTLYDNAKVTGWHTGYPDALTLLDPTTARDIPWEPGVVAMLGDFRGADGKGHPGCGRSLLRRVVQKAEALGFEPLVGVEFEFFLFQETPQSLQEKGFRGMTPADPGHVWLQLAAHGSGP